MPVKTCPQCGTEYPITQLFCPTDGAPLTAPTETESLEGRLIAGGRYQVLTALSAGGMGQVFTAMQVRMNRKVALKVMRPEFAANADAIQRFHQEAQNASKISHPNVASVYDFGDAEGGMMFIAMEFITGKSLAEEIRERGVIAPVRAARIVTQIAEALQAVHDAGIVHRDLKPDNVMLQQGRTGDMVKLVDFGISKVGADGSQKVTTTGNIVGTIDYLSPDQARALALDGRSDVYSLGLVAYKMLTGVLPFVAEGFEAITARLYERPRRLSEAKKDFGWGEQLEKVMERVLESDREKRYQTAPEFAHDLALAVQSPDVRTIELHRDDDKTLIAGIDIGTLPPPVKGPGDNALTPRRVAIGVGGLAVLSALAFAATRGNSGAPPRTVPPPPDTSGPILADRGKGALAAPAAPSAKTGDAKESVSRASTTAVSYRIGVNGLDATARAAIAKAVHNASGVALEESASGAADVTVRAREGGNYSITGAGGTERLPFAALSTVARVLPRMARNDAALAALRAYESPGVLQARFATGSGNLKVDDHIVFRVSATNGGYLTLIDIDPAGAVTVLHPTGGVDVGALTPNTEILVPNSQSGAQYPVGLPAGAGSVLVIVSGKPLNLGATDGDVLGQVKRALTRMKNEGTAVSTQSLPYTIRDKTR